MRRAKMSVGPPAAKPTTSRTGRVGYCADATPQVAIASAAMPRARRRKLSMGSPVCEEVAGTFQCDLRPVARRRALGAERMRQLDAERNVRAAAPRSRRAAAACLRPASRACRARACRTAPGWARPDRARRRRSARTGSISHPAPSRRPGCRPSARDAAGRCRSRRGAATSSISRTVCGSVASGRITANSSEQVSPNCCARSHVLMKLSRWRDQSSSAPITVAYFAPNEAPSSIAGAKLATSVSPCR